VKFSIAVALSWLNVTLIHVTAFQWDGIDFAISELLKILTLFGITSLFVAFYMLILGGVALVMMNKFKLLNRIHYVSAGVICSLPMILSGEIEWQIAAIVSGLCSGLIMSSMAVNKNVT
jgi:hypothetical protein